jgi:hypothetical protein
MNSIDNKLRNQLEIQPGSKFRRGLAFPIYDQFGVSFFHHWEFQFSRELKNQLINQLQEMYEH